MSQEATAVVVVCVRARARSAASHSTFFPFAIPYISSFFPLFPFPFFGWMDGLKRGRESEHARCISDLLLSSHASKNLSPFSLLSLLYNTRPGSFSSPPSLPANHKDGKGGITKGMQDEIQERREASAPRDTAAETATPPMKEEERPSLPAAITSKAAEDGRDGQSALEKGGERGAEGSEKVPAESRSVDGVGAQTRPRSLSRSSATSEEEGQLVEDDEGETARGSASNSQATPTAARSPQNGAGGSSSSNAAGDRSAERSPVSAWRQGPASSSSSQLAAESSHPSNYPPRWGASEHRASDSGLYRPGTDFRASSASRSRTSSSWWDDRRAQDAQRHRERDRDNREREREREASYAAARGGGYTGRSMSIPNVDDRMTRDDRELHSPASATYDDRDRDRDSGRVAQGWARRGTGALRDRDALRSWSGSQAPPAGTKSGPTSPVTGWRDRYWADRGGERSGETSYFPRPHEPADDSPRRRRIDS